MALDKQLIDIPTNAGVDTKMDSVNDVPPNYSDILNFRMPYTSQFTPRDGFSATGSVSSGTPGYVVGLRDAVFSENDEALYKTAAGTSVQLGRSWSPYTKRLTLGLLSSGTNTGASKVTSCVLSDGRVLCVWANSAPNAGFSWQILGADGDYLFGGSQAAPNALDFIQIDAAAGPGVTGTVSVIDSTGALLVYSITNDASTSMTVASRTGLSEIKTYYYASKLFTLYKTSAPSTVIELWTYSGSTLSSAGSLVLVAAAPAGRRIDLVPTTNFIALAYWSTTSTVRIGYMSSTGTLSVTYTTVTDATAYTQMNGFGITPHGTDLVTLCYSGASNTLGAYLSVYTQNVNGTITSLHAQTSVSFLTVTSPVTIDNKIVVGAIDLAVQGNATNGLLQVADIGTAVGAGATIELFSNWSSGSATTGRVSALMSRSSAIPFNTVGRISKSASGIFVPSMYINRVTGLSESLLFTGIGLVAPEEMVIPVVTGENVACVLYADLTATASTVGIRQGDSAAIVGPKVTPVDGIGVGPSTVWPMFAPQDLLLQNATGLTASSTYFVVFVKRWVDGYGNSQTMETPAVRIVTDSGTYLRPQFGLSKGAFKIPGSENSTTAEASIDVYLTEANGTIPYYNQTITSASSFFSGAAPYYFVINNSSVDLSQPLPSSSGDIPNTSPSGIRHATVWKGRTAVLVADNPRLIMYSKPVLDNDFISFAPGLEVEVPQADTELTALASMDGVLYAFSDNQTYTIYGDPAGSTGEGSTLTIPEIRFNGVGCEDPKSVILTPKGIFFKSAKGIYVILRNQELVFVGTGPFSDRDARITGAWASVDKSEVGYTLTDGTSWVYDWEQRAWFRWALPLTSVPDVVSSSTLLNGAVVYNTTSGLYIEDAASAEVIPVSVTTAWVRLNELQGYQRVYNVWAYLDYVAAHTLTVDLYIDGVETSVYTWTIASTSLGSATPEQIRLSMPIQKCSAFKLKFSSTNAGWKMRGLTAEIGIKPNSRYRNRNAPNNF